MIIMDNNKPSASVTSTTPTPPSLVLQSLKPESAAVSLSVSQGSTGKQGQNARGSGNEWSTAAEENGVRRSVHATFGGQPNYQYGGGAASQRSSAVLVHHHHNINSNYLDNLSTSSQQQIPAASSSLQAPSSRIISPKKQQQQNLQALKRCTIQDSCTSNQQEFNNPKGPSSLLKIESEQSNTTNSVSQLQLQQSIINNSPPRQQQPQSTQSCINKLAAPKPIRGGQRHNNNLPAPPVLMNAAKWSQASPIKTEGEQKNHTLLMEGRRQSSVQSQSEFQLSDECFGSQGDNQSAARRINFQNEQNLSFIIQHDDEFKHRSNSPIKELRELLEVEREFASIFNKSRLNKASNFQEVLGPKEAVMMRGPLNLKVPIFSQHLSPDARSTTDQSFSTLSCSFHTNFKQASLFSSQITSVASIERPSVPMTNSNNINNADLASQYSFGTNSQSLGGGSYKFGGTPSVNFIHPIKRISCNPFKKSSSPEPSSILNKDQTYKEGDNLRHQNGANNLEDMIPKQQETFIKLEDQEIESACNLQAVSQYPTINQFFPKQQQEQTITIEDQQETDECQYNTPETGNQIQSEYQSMMYAFGQMMTASPYAGYQNSNKYLGGNINIQPYSSSLENSGLPFQLLSCTNPSQSYEEDDLQSLQHPLYLQQHHPYQHQHQLSYSTQSIVSDDNNDATVLAMQDQGYIQYGFNEDHHQIQYSMNHQSAYYQPAYLEDNHILGGCGSISGGGTAMCQSLGNEGGQYLTGALYYYEAGGQPTQYYYAQGEEGQQVE